MQQALNTLRLQIRPIALTDDALMLSLVNSPGWLEFIGDRQVHNLSDAQQYIQHIINQPHFYYYVMEELESGEAVGILSLLYRDSLYAPNFGFALLPAYEKRGYAYEASRAFLDAFVLEQPLTPLYAITLPHNIKSIQLLDKLGFRYVDNEVSAAECLHRYMLATD